MAEEQKSLCRVETVEGEFYLLTTCHDDGKKGFDLALCDGKKAWIGSVMDGDLEVMSNKTKLTYNELVNQTRRALTRENMGSFNFQYQVKYSGNDILQFTWKKHLEADNIKFQLGSSKLKLRPSPVALIQEIFSHIIKSTEQFQDKITALQSENERLASERDSALKKLEKSVKTKQALEEDMYEKFVTVLNDKKQKIRDLRDEVEKLMANGVPSTSGVQSQTQNKTVDTDDEPSSTPKKITRKTQNDSEYDTDDEQKATQSPSKKIKVTQADNVSQDSSLILDDGTMDDSPTVLKRRKRGPSTTKKTPSKPVIPRVPSSEGRNRKGTSSTRSSRGSVNRGGSNLSKSSDDVDPEKLLAELEEG